jgi:hypothetical protein
MEEKKKSGKQRYEVRLILQLELLIMVILPKKAKVI